MIAPRVKLRKIKKQWCLDKTDSVDPKQSGITLSVDIQKIMGFVMIKGNKITELLQLESPQSEFCSSGYKIKK
jgi:hypothetical protein